MFSQPAGYYDVFNLSSLDTDLITDNIKAGVSIFGISGKTEVVANANQSDGDTDGTGSSCDDDEGDPDEDVVDGDGVAGDSISGLDTTHHDGITGTGGGD